MVGLYDPACLFQLKWFYGKKKQHWMLSTTNPYKECFTRLLSCKLWVELLENCWEHVRTVKWKESYCCKKHLSLLNEHKEIIFQRMSKGPALRFSMPSEPKRASSLYFPVSHLSITTTTKVSDLPKIWEHSHWKKCLYYKHNEDFRKPLGEDILIFQK